MLTPATHRTAGNIAPGTTAPGPALTGQDPERLRTGDPPVVGRIVGDRLLLDPRTLADDEVAPAAAAVRGAVEAASR